MNLITKFMTRNDCYTAGKKIVPKGIMVHSTATPGVMAARWFSLWNKSYKAGEIDRQACVHAFVDDKEVWQYLPWNHRGWHGGGTANNTHIGFEICEPPGFSYGKGSTMIGYDVKKNEPYFRAAWKNAVELCVMLCKQFSLTELDIIDHSEGHTRGIASNHGDVAHWFPKHGESMKTFRAAVKSGLITAPVTLPPTQEKPVSEENMTQEEFNRMFTIAMTDYNKSIAALPPSEWALCFWQRMCGASIFDGSAPRAPLTREQAATIISRLIDKGTIGGG